jgi:multidrug efflux system outer membrane protein
VLDFLPVLTASADHKESLTPLTQAPTLTRAQRESDTYNASFDARWEIDLFGRLRRGNESARAEAAAALAGWQFSQVTVAAEVTRSYLTLRGLQGQLAVATGNAGNQSDTLRLTEQRLDAGRGTELDSARARAQLNTTLANVPTLEASIAQTIYQLSVLTGQVPAALKSRLLERADLPVAPAITKIGAPAQLLRRRPDIRAAERQLAAATARVGVSVADFFPSVSFGARVGNSAGSTQDLFSAPNDFFSFGPQLSWAFLDLGHVRERVVRARAGAERSLANYEQTVLRALQETESALVTYDRARRSSEYLQLAAQASESASSLARLRFQDGVSDFLVVLDAERSVLDAQDRLVRNRTAEATALVAVYKALGGGWNEAP